MLAGVILVIGLVINALYLRIFGIFPNPDAPWATLLAKLDIPLDSLGWPLLVLGTTWIAGLCALSLGIGWNYKVLRIAASLSLLLLGWGTILAAIAILGILLPTSKPWLKLDRVADGP
jgi:hypothetical protein